LRLGQGKGPYLFGRKGDALGVLEGKKPSNLSGRGPALCKKKEKVYDKKKKAGGTAKRTKVSPLSNRWGPKDLLRGGKNAPGKKKRRLAGHKGGGRDPVSGGAVDRL